MTEEQAKKVVAEVKKEVGNSYKRVIRDCWTSHSYIKNGLDNYSVQLQRIRNTLGPSWLSRVKV